ncbi:MAG: GNAT family N-acetyltransferase [Fibrobacterota bacterium]|nr:GNAT family N-acyltransferase [Chitinispirillaceae bacterium]
MFKNPRLHLKKLLPLTDAIFRSKYLPVKKFNPNVKLFIERDRFIIKTVENHEELANALRLRYEVFYRELLEKRRVYGFDFDRFDFKCDHLVIIDKKSNTFIGTYRLISSLFAKEFYSETEFDISNILALPGVKLELGRACVHKDYRTGSSIALLWRGIMEYMKLTNTQYLFGCSSVKTTEMYEIALMHQVLARDFVAPANLVVYPKSKFKIRNFNELKAQVRDEDLLSVVEKIPPLIKSYLNMGAQICGEPALDKKFKCADFLTLFNTDTSVEKVHKKYKL